MAITLALNDIVEARVLTQYSAQISLNILHFKTTVIAGTSATLDQTNARMDTLWQAAYKALMSSAAQYRGVGVRRIFPGPVTIEYTYAGSVGNGTVAGNAMPKQICGLLTKKTEVSGRKGRGRVYVPFPGQADNDTTNVPIAGYMTRLGTLATALFGPIVVGTAPNTATLEACVWDRAAFQARMMGWYTSRQKWATQRRRGDYGRTNLPPF